MAVIEIDRTETTELQRNGVQLGLIPVGKEELHRIYPDDDIIRAVNFIFEHCLNDYTIRNFSRVFSKHETDDYTVASSLRPSRESEGFCRSSSIIVPKLGRTCFSGYFSETHLYLPYNPNEIDPDHIRTIEERHLIPFQHYGRQLQEAA